MDYRPIYNQVTSSYYQEEQAVRYCQCDYNHRLKLSELFQMFSDLAVTAFAFRGMDTQFLLGRQMVFVISRMAVGIRRMPREGEKLCLSTWEQEVQRAQFLRNFQVWDQAGDLLMEARSGWALVNPFTRAIMRPQEFDEALPGRLLPMPEEDCGAPAFLRLRLKETDPDTEPAGERKAVYSDIDGNGHVDNARYLDMAMDVLPQGMTAREPAEVQVLFSRETMPGETLSLFRKVGEDGADVKGIIGGKDSFCCRIRFR